MRSTVALCLMLAALPASGNALVDAITPSPFTIALEIGKWIYLDREQVFKVQVQGAGATEREAREQAFALAADEALGSLILSQTEVVNQTVKRNHVLKYNSGVIRKFKVLETFSLPTGETAVRMEVWVSKNLLAEGLLATDRSVTQDLTLKSAAALGSYHAEVSQGNRLLREVLADYPAKAFDLSVSKTQINASSTGLARLTMSINIKWNRDFAQSLKQVLEQTSQVSYKQDCVWEPSQSTACWSVHMAMPVGFARGPFKWGYLDQQRFDVIHSNLVDSRPVVAISLRDVNGRVMHKECKGFSRLHPVAAGTYHSVTNAVVEERYGRNIKINADWEFSENVGISAPLTQQQLEWLADMTVSVVPQKSC